MATPAVGTEAAIFSAPVAGGRLAGGDVLVAGLVVSSGALVGARLDAAGHLAWSRPLVPHATWSADAELHGWPIAAGAVFVWRGPIGGKSGHVAVAVAPDGRVIDGPFDVGSLVCATDDGLAWGEAGKGDAMRVHLRTWGTDGAKDRFSEPIQDEMTLTCGGGKAYAVVEGDEGTATRVFAVGGAETHGPLLTMPPGALGRDEERDLFSWAEGGEFGLVRVAAGGGVQAGELRGAELAPTHAEPARLPPEDDVVVLDASERDVILVTTHDESDKCPEGRGGDSVHALRIPRAGGAASALEISKGECSRDVGPFWSNVASGSVIAGWVERGSKPGRANAPITGFAYRVFGAEGAGTKRVAQAADFVADAGCDSARCYAVALVREPGEDGTKPEAIKILAYP